MKRATRRRSRCRSCAGQALVEFALVAPIFFLVLFSIIEFGRYVYNVEILNNAAREGARYAIVHGSTSTKPSGPLPGGFPNTWDQTGQKIKDVVTSNAVGVVGGPGAVDVQVIWGCQPADPCGPPYESPDNARDNRVTVLVGYDFKTLVPIVPIPPIHITGASTLVINH
jgi:TadE-like protein